MRAVELLTHPVGDAVPVADVEHAKPLRELAEARLPTKKGSGPLFHPTLLKYAGNQPDVQPVWAASKSATRFSNGISGVKTLAGLTR